MHESVIIGVVSDKSAVFSYYCVYCPDGCRLLGKLVQERYNVLFIRYGDIKAFPFSTYYESFQLLRFFLE